MKMFYRTLTLLVCLFSLSLSLSAQTRNPMPLQSPSVSRTHIAFSYAGDIWIVDRAGGDARRLTSTPVLERVPLLSPDGTEVAFARNNPAGGPLSWDVYVVPVSGGEARRLTYHPEADIPVGWTPDGRNVLLTSFRERMAYLGYRLYTIPKEGGFPTPLQLPTGFDGSLSPDGRRIAYTPLWGLTTQTMRNYRGGATSRIFIADLSAGSAEEIPHVTDTSNYEPMWIGEKVYFLSDRTGTVNLFSYDATTKRVEQLTRYEKYDVKSAGASDDAVVFVQDGALHLFDLKTGATRNVEIRVAGDFPETKPRTVDALRWTSLSALSPNGESLLFGARGEVMTVNVKTGEAVNLTRTPGVAERSPAWSPDGKWMAYFSDESGENELHLRSFSDNTVRRIRIEQRPSFYSELTWSPDSKKLAFSDAHLNLWYVELDGGAQARKADTALFSDGARYFQPFWSPDSNWLAYSKYQPNRQRAVFIYSLQTAKSYQVSAPEVDARWPTFDRNGRYLYFTGSVNSGPVKYGMSAMPFNNAVTRSAYAAVLGKDDVSPLATTDREENQRQAFVVDVEGLGQRVVRIPFEGRNAERLMAGQSGRLFIVEGGTLHRYTVGAERAEKFTELAGNYRISGDGSRLLLRRRGVWAVVSSDSLPKPEDGALSLKTIEIQVEPRAEWQQMYNEAWRLVREYFYDPNMHGQNLAELRAHYQAYLPNVVTREGLNELSMEMFSHLSISHIAGISGGDMLAPAGENEKIGLLGADFEIDNGRYRLAHIYRGNPSMEGLQAPLGQPGLNVKEGDYLLSVDGADVSASENLYKLFTGKAGKPVELKIAAAPDGKSARTIRVVPVASEYPIRQYEWIERNRRRVAELSGGRLAYVYMSDTFNRGYELFNRDFYAQLDKQGLILDARFNDGGVAADYVIEILRRTPLQAGRLRDGGDVRMPVGMITGPKVMLTNEMSGSGGDTLPWMWRQSGLGMIVGKRSSGLGVAASTQDLIDGGRINVPDWGWYNPAKGIWDIENRGVAPDVEIEATLADWRAGRDPQLEKAVELALRQMATKPAPSPQRPSYPIYK
ncbi:MAG TPA: PDZ domain-containing protein [Pyrinomonadaceae bacterium]|nr:PDZ domain-containing protein [Pyrinomonadaceae bacterium]